MRFAALIQNLGKGNGDAEEVTRPIYINTANVRHVYTDSNGNVMIGFNSGGHEVAVVGPISDVMAELEADDYDAEEDVKETE